MSNVKHRNTTLRIVGEFGSAVIEQLLVNIVHNICTSLSRAILVVAKWEREGFKQIETSLRCISEKAARFFGSGERVTGRQCSGG